MKCAQVKILRIPLRSQRTLSAHPSPLEIGLLSSSMNVAPPVASSEGGGLLYVRLVVNWSAKHSQFCGEEGGTKTSRTEVC